MPPRDIHHNYGHADTVQERAAIELEEMRDTDKAAHNLHPLPSACFRMLKSLPGNHRCIDCGAQDPDWAAVSYGALVCLQCSGRHRSLGVQVRPSLHTISFFKPHFQFSDRLVAFIPRSFPVFVP